MTVYPLQSIKARHNLKKPNKQHHKYEAKEVFFQMAEGGGENLPSDDHDPNVKRKMIIQEY